MELTELDNRRGVGLRPDGLPDIIEWVKIPAFSIARYPVTYAQFQVFLDAPDGFYNAHWWDGLAADKQHRSAPGEVLQAVKGAVCAFANAVGVAVEDEAALEQRFDQVAQGVMHHAIPERRGADLALLGFVNEEMGVCAGRVGVVEQLHL